MDRHLLGSVGSSGRPPRPDDAWFEAGIGPVLRKELERQGTGTATKRRQARASERIESDPSALFLPFQYVISS